MMFHLVAYALFSINFGGYYENQVTFLNLKQKWLVQDYNRLRLDMSMKFGEKASFNADGIAQTFHGVIQYNGLDFLPDSLTEMIPDSLRPMYIIPFQNYYYLDNAELSLYWRRLILKIGKQQFAWGTGYVWNPTEIIRPKALFDPTYEREGTNALKIAIPWRTAGALEGILILNQKIDSSTWCFRLKENLYRFDFALSYARMIEESMVLQIKERREFYGGEFAGEILGIGIWAEGAYNRLSDTLNYPQFIVGGDYTFKFQTYFLTEYFHNGYGHKKEDYTLENWQRLIFGEIQGLGKDYLFSGISHPLFDFHRFSLYSLTNLSDQSFVLMPQFQYSFSENIEISLLGFYSFGEKGSEFASFGIKGGFLRLRAYF